MTPARVLAELEAIAARIGVAVRAEPFGGRLLEGRGGLCWVHGRPLVVMDASLGVPDRIAVLAAALARFELDSVYVAPAVRDVIEAARRRAGGEASTRKRARTKAGERGGARPGLARTRPRGR